MYKSLPVAGDGFGCSDFVEYQLSRDGRSSLDNLTVRLWQHDADILCLGSIHGSAAERVHCRRVLYIWDMRQVRILPPTNIVHTRVILLSRDTDSRPSQTAQLPAEKPRRGCVPEKQMIRPPCANLRTALRMPATNPGKPVQKELSSVVTKTTPYKIPIFYTTRFRLALQGLAPTSISLG